MAKDVDYWDPLDDPEDYSASSSEEEKGEIIAVSPTTDEIGVRDVETGETQWQEATPEEMAQARFAVDVKIAREGKGPIPEIIAASPTTNEIGVRTSTGETSWIPVEEGDAERQATVFQLQERGLVRGGEIVDLAGAASYVGKAKLEDLGVSGQDIEEATKSKTQYYGQVGALRKLDRFIEGDKADLVGALRSGVPRGIILKAGFTGKQVLSAEEFIAEHPTTKEMTRPVSADHFVSQYFREKGWELPTYLGGTFHRGVATDAEVKAMDKRAREAIALYEKKFGGGFFAPSIEGLGHTPLLTSGLTKLTSQVFPAARSWYPEVKVKDIKASEWAFTGLNLALLASPIWFPKIPGVGALKAPAVKPTVRPAVKSHFTGARIFGETGERMVFTEAPTYSAAPKWLTTPKAVVGETPISQLVKYSTIGRIPGPAYGEVPGVLTSRSGLTTAVGMRESWFFGGGPGRVLAPPKPVMGTSSATVPTTLTMTEAQLARFTSPVAITKAVSPGIIPVAIPSLVPTQTPGITSTPGDTPSPGTTTIPLPKPVPIIPVHPWVRQASVIKPVTSPVTAPVTPPTPSFIPSPISTPALIPTPFSFPRPTLVPIPFPAPTPMPVPTPGLYEVPTPVFPPEKAPTKKAPPPLFPGFGAPQLRDGGRSNRIRLLRGPVGGWKLAGFPVFGTHPLTGRVVGGMSLVGEVRYGATKPRVTIPGRKKKKRMGILSTRIDGGSIGSTGRMFRGSII